jgi:hypothetical protein
MKSTLSTVVAVVRHETGLIAPHFAKLIGKPYATLKSLESGRLKLSERTALDISRATGVGLAWLLAGDPKEPIITNEGTLWTHEIFSWHEGQAVRKGIYESILKEHRRSKDAVTTVKRLMAVDLGNNLRKLLERVYGDDDAFSIACAKAQRFLNDLERDLRK